MTPSVCASLQIHCINSIAAEFDRFCIAYSSPDSNIPKRHFEFLQRKYTKDLLTTLKSTKSLRNEHLDFMINRYTKEFDLYQFDGCDWENIEEKLVNVGDVIAQLTLSMDPEYVSNGTETFIEDLDWKKFPRLEILNLSRSSFCDNTLILIAKYCPLLKVLDVSYCAAITNKAFISLTEDNNTCSYINLKTLNVYKTGVNDEGISYILEHIPSLETIKYKDVPQVLYERHKKDFEANCLSSILNVKYNLTSLEFVSVPDSLTDILSACAILCPKLKSLTVTVFTMEELNICSNFHELESVCLTGIGVLASDIRMISINSFLEKRGRNLINLDLCYFSISVFKLAKCCPKLRKLDLKCMSYESVDDCNISPLKFLKSLYLEDAAFTDENSLKSLFSILSASCQLEILQMPYCQFHIQNHNKMLINCMMLLKEINLSFTDIEVSFLKSVILSSQVLEKLAIECCENISAKQYSELSELIGTVKNNVKLIWSAIDSELQSDFSDTDNDDYDFYDDYIDYGDDDFGEGFYFDFPGED